MALVVFVTFFVGTLLGGLALSYHYVQREDRAFSTCMAKIWYAQNEQMKILEELLDLNPQVAELRTERTAARQRLAEAIESLLPPAIAAAEAHLLYIESQIFMMDQNQRRLLTSADLIAEEFNSSAAASIEKNSKAQNIQVERLEFAVYATPAGETMPFYRTREPFSYAQQAGAKWKITNLRGGCHATLESRGGKWFVRMQEDRS